MHVNLRNVWFALLAVVVVFTSVHAQEQEDKTLAPYFVVQGDPSVDHLPLKDTRVEISVSGVIADVKVRQIYRNEGAQPINASYVFPASTRAAVYAMRMQLGNEIIVAKIKEREQAKQDFEKAKEEGKSASLLEQERPNVFSMSLANIMPQEQVEIELHYTELLIPTDNIYEFVFPRLLDHAMHRRRAGTRREMPLSKRLTCKAVRSPPVNFTSLPGLRLACRFTISRVRRIRSFRNGRATVWRS
jgi:Ca-activated chloride channel family protein